jgi:hypothetical protein
LPTLGVLIACGLALAQEKPQDKPKPARRFTIGKETTYVTGPCDKDGYVDYAAALNERLKKGVTPANNANVLLWKALGPHPEGTTMPAEFFRLLEIDPPPEKGDYFVDLFVYFKEQLKLNPNDQAELLNRDLTRAAERPWRAKDYPHLVAWLQANEKPLALTIQASQRPEYFYPLVSKPTEQGVSTLMNALLPSVQKSRSLANALLIRAMLRVDEGRIDDAWCDLLACHRLGRVIARGGTLIELLVGIAMDSLASRADLALLDHERVDARRIRQCLRDLQALPPMPIPADKIDLSERCMILETILLTERHGIDILERIAAGGGANKGSVSAWLSNALLKNANGDSALRSTNQWCDRVVAAMREKERGSREKQLARIEKDLIRLKMDLDSGRLAKLVIGTPDEKGRLVGDLVICLFTPAVLKLQAAADRSEQTQRILHLAFALAGYHRDHGRYPPSLDKLAPAYLARIPLDLFSGEAVIYRPTEKGYLLYSVGPNGKDEQGRGRDDEPAGDDLTIRMPLPPVKD